MERAFIVVAVSIGILIIGFSFLGLVVQAAWGVLVAILSLTFWGLILIGLCGLVYGGFRLICPKKGAGG